MHTFRHPYAEEFFVGCRSKIFPHVHRPSPGIARLGSPLPALAVIWRRGSVRFMLRTACLLGSFLSLCHWASTPGSLPAPGIYRRASPPVSYGAAWSLLRPDFHRQVWSSLAGHTNTKNPTPMYSFG